MPRWLLLLVALASGVAGLGFAYLATRAAPEQGLVAAEFTHDFGELSQGDKVDCEFRLTNRFDRPLTIRNVIKSCGCTNVELSGKALEPGEVLHLKAEWNVGGSRGPSGVALSVIAALPDDTLAITELHMVGTVAPDIVYEPEKMEFSPDMTTRQVVFSPGRMRDFTLNRVYCTHKAFEARLLPDGAHVEVTYRPEAFSEDVPKVYLMVDTTSPHEPACRIPLTAAPGGKAGQ
jgi:hypothetical protein